MPTLSLPKRNMRSIGSTMKFPLKDWLIRRMRRWIVGIVGSFQIVAPITIGNLGSWQQ